MKKEKVALILNMLITTPVFASIDFKADFNDPQDIAPYQFKGSKDNNNDSKPDEMYHRDGNKVLLIEDTDYDGKINRIFYSEDGVLIKMEEDIQL